MRQVGKAKVTLPLSMSGTHGRPKRSQDEPLNLVVDPKPVFRPAGLKLDGGHKPGPKPRPEPVLTDIQVVKRESADRVRELIEANNRELKRRRELVITMKVILVRSNCMLTRDLARKALEKDEELAKSGGG